MEFDREVVVSHPAALVLRTVMDRVEEIVPFMPSVAAIETVSRRRLAGGKVRIVRHWQGAASSLPAPLRPFLSEELLGWTDTAIWDPSRYRADWELSTTLSKFFDCTGVSLFEPHPRRKKTATVVRIMGRLEIFPERVPGIPRILGRRLAPQIESFVVGLLTPNLTELASGLQVYLDRAGRQAR